MDEGAIEPLDVVVLGEGQQDLVADDGERQQEDGATRHGERERAQVQSASAGGGSKLFGGFEHRMCHSLCFRFSLTVNLN